MLQLLPGLFGGRYSALAAVFQPVFSKGRYEVSGVEAVCS